MTAKDLNEIAILNQMLARRIVTVPRLAKILSLPNSTVVSVIRRMSRRGLIYRGEDLPSKRGRPEAAYYPLLPDKVVVCLVDGTSLSIALIEKDLLVKKLRKQSKSSGQQAESWVSEISSLIKPVAKGTDVKEVVLCANAVEVKGQRLTSSVVPEIGKVLSQLVTDLLPLEVHWGQWPVLLAAHRHLPDPAPDPMLLLNIADGVSASCMVDGTAFRGGNGLAGELGHVVVEEDGPACGCGRNGCLEACCSGPAIKRQVVEGLKRGAVSRIVLDEFSTLPSSEATELVWQHWLKGDEFVLQIMNQVLDRIAWGLGLAINLTDPRAVVSTGYVLHEHDAWFEEIKRRAKRWILHANRREIQFTESPATLENVLQTAALQHVYLKYHNNSDRWATPSVATQEDRSDHLHRLLSDITES